MRTIQDFRPLLWTGSCDAAAQLELAALLERLRDLMMCRAALADEMARLEARYPIVWFCRVCHRAHPLTDTHCPYCGTSRPEGLERRAG